MENFTYLCRRFLLISLCCALLSQSHAQQVAKSLTASNGSLIGFYEYKPEDYNPTSSYKYPLIIFLHGIGERGNGTTELYKLKAQALPKYIDRGHKMRFFWNGKWETFIVLSPQLNSKYGSWQRFYTEEMLAYAKKNLNIDTNRIILTGLSLGGGGVWNFSSYSLDNARQFAAIAPICGTCSMVSACNIAKANLPVWTEHASDDPTVSVNCTINANKAINSCNAAVKPIEFIHPDGKHVIWNRAYDTVYKWHEPNIYEWFLGQNKSLPVNKLPVAQATGNSTVYLEDGVTTLDGRNSSDADGKIVKYIWRQLSGPAITTIGSRTGSSTAVTSLSLEGSYTYELTVVDNRTGWTKDTIEIAVSSRPKVINQAPVANAGTNKSITLPVNYITLDGTGSSDSDGSIAQYSWTRISGGAATISTPNNATTSVTGLVEGTYNFKLTVTDNNGATSADTVRVIVNAAPNQAPVANAGTNASITLPINNITLDGSGSSDSDGSIAKYSWTKISGGAATIVNLSSVQTEVTGLIEGTYQFALSITDNNGATSADTVRVIVNAAPNQAPVANAGTNASITLPINNITLDGTGSSDSDGSIAQYAWTKISGGTATIVNPSIVQTEVTGLIEGTYQFALSITDNNGATSADTVRVIVNAAPNQAPVANAGTNKSITLPVNNITLDGSGSSDSDGSIAQYAWTKISGGTATIVNPSSVQTEVTGLIEGTYQFALSITDNNGATSADTVRVIVNPAPNQAPVANAGTNKSITLPVNNITLDGSGSSDSDGSITQYSWIKISGGTATISNPNAAVTNIENLEEGKYFFQLEVTDNQGATSFDTVRVIVNATPNQAPVANAGTNTSITLPINNITLDGTGSSDSDGNISKYAWTKISGGTATIINPSSVQTEVTGLTEGTYQFELEVTDNNGETSADTVRVIVNPAPNQAPVANAGTNKSITLPVNNITLDGSGSSDSDGNISQYTWTKISGGTVTISTPNNATTSVTGLVEGTYNFKLTVTDNQGAIAADTVRVIVNPAPNQAPVANAGTNKSITLPVNSITLDGSGSRDTDGSISQYAWTKISGGTATIVSPNASTTKIENLQEGKYFFQLEVTDNKGATSYDTVRVIVNATPNQAPVANAGTNRSITLPVNNITLDGTGSGDSDGSIAQYAWTKISGGTATIVSPNAAVTNIENLEEGKYFFQLEVTDDKGETSTDTVRVIVYAAPNQAPVANAGTNKSITLPVNSITLDGSGSSDSDGSIAQYAWTKISGGTANIIYPSSVQTEVSGLTAGTYQFELTITDNQGAESRDTVSLVVHPAPNKAPVAKAGNDLLLTLPINSATLNGSASSDPDGNIIQYSWNFLSGPKGSIITNPNDATTKVEALIAGSYRFVLIVTDNKGAKHADTIAITVMRPPNRLPIANAGNDTIIYYPQTSFELNGSASSDPDGRLGHYSWEQVKGPASAWIENVDSANTKATRLTTGEYRFTLTVTDDRGEKASDTITVKVVNNMRSTDNLALYPNPTKGPLQVKVTSEYNGNCFIRVMDNFGKLVDQHFLSKTSVEQIITFQTTKLTPGIYYLEFDIQGNKRMVTRFIKQ